MTQKFSERVKEIIKMVPPGKVATYGQIATIAGNPRGARQVVWVLHTSGDNLPWHRIINSKGRISLPHSGGYETQRDLLEKEGIEFNENDRIDLDRYLWQYFD
jgi:methylated-DNA-protein-cysteine methyltransferase-like protein